MRAARVLRRRWVQALIMLMIGAALLVALLVTVDLGDVGRALEAASVLGVLAGIALYLGFILVRGWRWQVILQASAPQSRIGDAMAITALGWAANAVVPFKLGDVLRIATMARRARVGLGEAGATVVLERVLDVLTLLFLAILSGAASGGQSSGTSVWQRLAVLSIISAMTAVVAFWLVRDEERSLRLWTLVSGRLPSRLRVAAAEVVISVMRGFRCLRSPGRLASCALLGIIAWGLAVASFFALFRALSAQLSPATLALAMTLFIITQAISVTPASIGTYELFFIGTLLAFGASPRSVLTAAAVLSHGAATISVVLWGALGALWLRLVPASPPVRLEQALASQDGA